MDLKELEKKRKEHSIGGGMKKQKQRTQNGKLNAFERINSLFDSESFVEIDPFVTHECFDFGMESKKILGDGVITGYGN